MNTVLFLLLAISLPTFASVVGISTHPLNDEARVLSAEMTGFMSQQHEVGMGLRYTQELDTARILDISAAGGQDSRAFSLGAGMDLVALDEDVYQPRTSLKPFIQYQKIDGEKYNFVGVAPTLRKGFNIQGQDFFPYLGLPGGIKITNSNDEFVYFASVTLGASMPFPGFDHQNILLSLEGNKNLGATSDYLGCLVSWVWK
jgi:hypothetical protein